MELLKRIDKYGDSVKHNLLTILSFVQIPIKFMNDIITRMTTSIKEKLKKEKYKVDTKNTEYCKKINLPTNHS